MAVDYRKEYGKKYLGVPLTEIDQDIDRMEDKAEADEFREVLLHNLIDNITRGYLLYDLKKPFINSEAKSLYGAILQKYGKDNKDYFQAYLFFVEKKYRKMEKLLTDYYSSRGKGHEKLKKMGTEAFAYNFLSPFKQGYDGYWDFVIGLLDSVKAETTVMELAYMIRDFYATDEADRQLDILQRFLMRHPDSMICIEMLSYTYYRTKMWQNAIACFEKIAPDAHVLYWNTDVLFCNAWCYGKCKDHKTAIALYQEAIDAFPPITNARNNMGYEYYLDGQYEKALEVFQGCLNEERDIKWAPNNYVRTLIAMKRFADAKEFIKSSKYRIAKDLRKKVSDAEDKNLPYSPADKQNEEEPASGGASDENVTALKNLKSSEQFSSEKLLEDELTLRLESGMEVFGKRLKIYKRKGEYGRQYIIPIGRLDLLCEDADHNLFVIELKKDEGYDDPYQQTKAYMEWFEAHKPDGVKDIYGIICLNNPAGDLKQKVHKDSRMQLFEYAISYTEI